MSAILIRHIILYLKIQCLSYSCLSVLALWIFVLYVWWMLLSICSPPLHSHGWFPRPARVGACRGVWCGQVPVSDPRSARARHQLGKRRPPCGHQGRQVGFVHSTMGHGMQLAELHGLFSRCPYMPHVLFPLAGTLCCLQVFCRLPAYARWTAESSAAWPTTAQGWNTVPRPSSLFQVRMDTLFSFSFNLTSLICFNTFPFFNICQLFWYALPYLITYLYIPS